MMCGESDCLYSIVKASEGQPVTQDEEAAIETITLYWKVKQQLCLALGLAQLVAIVALYLRMKNIVRFLQRRGSVQSEGGKHQAESEMVATESCIKRMYWITFISAVLVGTLLILINRNSSYDDLYKEQVFSIITEIEFCVVAILLAIFQKLLANDLNKISHLNFISEKNIILCTSMTFLIAYAIRATYKLLVIIWPNILLDLGIIEMIMAELTFTLICEFMPMLVL